MTTYGQSAINQAWYEICYPTPEEKPMYNSDLDDRTERTMCQTTCVECGAIVDWPNAHMAYPLCPDCDCADELPPASIPPSIRNDEPIQPASIITLIPTS
jgi:hypothetical protein